MSQNTLNYLVIIPARYESTRLPGKPLIDLLGLPMIIRTYRQCIESVPEKFVVVATDDERIERVCLQEGARVLRTSKKCMTGTDRVAEVAEEINADVYINVQGDEPLFNPADLSLLIDASKKYPSDVINGYCRIKSEAEFYNPNIPKIITSGGRLLYISRGGIPTNKSLEFNQGWRQVCAYAFPKNALIDFSACKEKTLLESIEDIEILRFVELGWNVKMIEMSDVSVSVDRPEDIELVKQKIRLK